jgi:hypothetical protein
MIVITERNITGELVAGHSGIVELCNHQQLDTMTDDERAVFRRTHIR